MSTSMTRRSLLKSAAVLGAAGAVASLPAAANADETAEESYTYADTIAWNAEYDVVVIGFGCAGAVSAVYAADAGAQVLLCDAAPEGEEGGNSRFACQMMFAGDDPDLMYTYIRDGLYWKFDADEEIIRVYAEELCNMEEHVAYLGCDEPTYWPNGIIGVCPEYSEYAGGETVKQIWVSGGNYNSALYKLVRNNVLDRSDKIDVWYGSPAVHLVQEPEEKTIVGVEIERGGETVLVRAVNGVVLACGGFEANTKMIQDYLGIARILPIGGLYNTGDGLRMGTEVGADLWHLSAYESLGMLCGHAIANDSDVRGYLERSTNVVTRLSGGSEEFAEGAIILVGDDGKRFLSEEVTARHGHIYSSGVWRMPIANYTPWLVFDQASYDTIEANGRFEDAGGRYDRVVSASTPEELAELIGLDPEGLAEAIETYNLAVEYGEDVQFGRDIDTMKAFEGDTYYALECRPLMLNTQGGPRRNKNAEVVDPEGNAIPHLYSAGELGGICAFQYNSGGNLAECVIFGQIAGTNAAAEKNPLPAYTGAPKVDVDIKYVAGEAGDVYTTDDIELGENEYLGLSNSCMGNELVVKATVADGVITAIEVVKEDETPMYGELAIEPLVEAALAAGTPDIDMVTGATMTSVAFIEALTEAYNQA